MFIRLLDQERTLVPDVLTPDPEEASEDASGEELKSKFACEASSECLNESLVSSR